MRFLFLGDGRLAKHLAAYLDFASIPHHTWSRRHTTELKSIIRDDDILCLTFADRDLEYWAAQMRKNFPQHTLVHFSGSLHIPGVLAYHPLMTFADQIYDQQTYENIPVVGEVGQPTFAQTFKGLPNPYFELAAEKKSVYHALVSMAANFPQLLWAEMAKELKSELNLDFSILAPLLRQSLENSLAAPLTAPTGPIIRKDYNSIHTHLDALDRRDLKSIYYAFLELKRELIFPTTVNPEIQNDAN